MGFNSGFKGLNDEEAPTGANLTERAILSLWSEFGNSPLGRSQLIRRLPTSGRNKIQCR